MVIDVMFTSQRGVCHMIRTDCWIYMSGNMTHVVSYLNDVWHEEKSRDSQTPECWSLWSWLTAGGGRATLRILLTPLFFFVCSFLLLFALLICYVILCAKTMIKSLIKSSLGQYVQLPDNDNSKFPPLHFTVKVMFDWLFLILCFVVIPPSCATLIPHIWQ